VIPPANGVPEISRYKQIQGRLLLAFRCGVNAAGSISASQPTRHALQIADCSRDLLVAIYGGIDYIEDSFASGQQPLELFTDVVGVTSIPRI